MTNQEYEESVRDHTIQFCGGEANDELVYAALALNGEAGEVAEWVKKVILRQKPGDLTDQDLRYELGDVQWYITRICHLKGWTLSEVMAANKSKLDARRKEAA